LKLLELMHSDVCWLMKTTSYGGAWHFVTFIDDFLKKNHVYLLKAKTKVFDKFKAYKVLLQNETNINIKTLWFNNGGEFVWMCHLRYLMPLFPWLSLLWRCHLWYCCNLSNFLYHWWHYPNHYWYCIRFHSTPHHFLCPQIYAFLFLLHSWTWGSSILNSVLPLSIIVFFLFSSVVYISSLVFLTLAGALCGLSFWCTNKYWKFFANIKAYW
jgi:hypothetical protein